MPQGHERAARGEPVEDRAAVVGPRTAALGQIGIAMALSPAFGVPDGFTMTQIVESGRRHAIARRERVPIKLDRKHALAL